MSDRKDISVMAKAVADRYTKTAAFAKQAGEVRFIKDKSDDKSGWAWGTQGPTERVIQEDFEFDVKNLKPLTITLRAALLSMGHALSAQAVFARIKSAQVSPDGSLGGKGYIQKIPDMRHQLMNCVEALSSFTDTLYDEVKAPHWNPAVEEQGKRERDDVKNIMTDVDEIRQNPEEFAKDEEEEMDDEPQGPSGKYARQMRVAHRYLEEQARN
jgi:hypothetical protein